MIRNTDENEIDVFISRFLENPGERAGLVAGLINGSGRLTLNVPGHGVARRIAERLREGTFSDYYEFEKLLARSLHPLMAGLNLNVISDLQVNSLFSERYLVYSRDLNIVLASGKKPSLPALRNIIVKMAAAEGHFMVIKFYDLVLRGIDANLCRSLKPVEAAVVRMKYALGDDGERNRVRVGKIYREFRDGKGEEAARLLLMRMEWDDALRIYGSELSDDADASAYDDGPGGAMAADEPVAALDKPSGAPDGEYAREEEAPSERTPAQDRESVIARYARIIREGYLDAVDPADEGRIRGLVRGIYLKNEMVYDSDRASGVVREVLGLWLADDTLDEGVRRILQDIAAEEETARGQEGYPDAVEDDDNRMEPAGKAPGEAEEGHEAEPAAGVPGEQEGEPVIENAPGRGAEVSNDGGDLDALLADMDEGFPADAEPSPEPQPQSFNEGVSGGELEALLSEHPEEASADDTGPSPEPQPQSFDEGVSGGELEALLGERPDEASAGEADTTTRIDRVSSGEGATGDDSDGPPADISDEIQILDENPAVVVTPETDTAGVCEGAPGAPADESGDSTPTRSTPAPPAAGEIDESFEPVLHEDVPADGESFVVKDEILFEDKSLVKKGSIARRRTHRIRISMKDIADTEGRKNLLDLMELLAGTESAADVSRYLVGSGVTPAIKYGVNDLVGCNDFEEAFDRVTGSEIFDFNEKIIILEKWLRAVGLKRGWFEPPHDGYLEKLKEQIGAYARGIYEAGTGGNGQPEESDPDMPDGGNSPEETGYPGGEEKPAELSEKPMLKTGDASIRISQEIYEFQSLYRAGAGKKTIAKKLPAIQKLFDGLASGDDSAVHFAVYHRQAFLDFLLFLDQNQPLKELLDIVPAMMYCRKNKII